MRNFVDSDGVRRTLLMTRGQCVISCQIGNIHQMTASNHSIWSYLHGQHSVWGWWVVTCWFPLPRFCSIVLGHEKYILRPHPLGHCNKLRHM